MLLEAEAVYENGVLKLDKPLPLDELKKCEQIVSSEEYKKHSDRSSHYLLGTLWAKLGRSDLTVAHMFLQASWQEKGDKEKEDLTLSEKYFRVYLGKDNKHGESWNRAQLILGELLRRQEKFDDARKHFDKLSTIAEFQENGRAKIVAFQQRLITKKDSTAHRQSEMDRAEQESRLSRARVPRRRVLLQGEVGFGLEANRHPRGVRSGRSRVGDPPRIQVRWRPLVRF